jgi:hypothetical protein
MNVYILESEWVADYRYLPEKGVSYESVLEWAEGKFAYFME